MTLFTRGILTLSFLILLPSIIFGQADYMKSDSAFAVYMDSAKAHLDKNKMADSLQNKYASVYFDYHLQSSDSPVGIDAGWQAFMMWGNTGAVVQTKQAISKLPDDSKLWKQIFNYVKGAYLGSEEKKKKDFIALLQNLKDRVEGPTNRSAVLYFLAEHYQEVNQREKARELFQQIIVLDGEDFYVDKALGNIHEMSSLNVGQQAPDFNAKTIQGEKISLQNLESKVIVLEFWATWCGPCMGQIPHLKALQKKYNSNEVQVVGIALNRNKDELKEFINENEMTWKQILQPDRREDEISKKYNINGIPDTYIISNNGKIVAKHLRGKKLEKKIAELVNS